jgi:hypothetical protein
VIEGVKNMAFVALDIRGTLDEVERFTDALKDRTIFQKIGITRDMYRKYGQLQEVEGEFGKVTIHRASDGDPVESIIIKTVPWKGLNFEIHITNYDDHFFLKEYQFA